MRQAGILSNRDDAERLADYLQTQEISVRVDPEGENWALWVHDEDQVPRAVDELEKFKAEPRAPRYLEAARAAAAKRKQQNRLDERRRKNMIDLSQRWRSPPGGYPLTIAMIVISVFVMIAGNWGPPRGEVDNALVRMLRFSPFPSEVDDPRNWTPTQAIEQGQVWRLITPIFLHGDLLHLLFNMFMLHAFGSAIESRRGSWRFAALVLVLAVASNYGEYFFEYHLEGIRYPINFRGMSGVVFGLFGYIWMKTKFQPGMNLYVHPNTVAVLLIWFVLCWLGIVGSIANWAHTAGLVAGMAIGYAPIAWRRMSKR